MLSTFPAFLSFMVVFHSNIKSTEVRGHFLLYSGHSISSKR